MLIFLITTIDVITKISANKLKVGGEAMLAIKIKNQNKGVILHHDIIPLVSKSLREWFVWYRIKAIINIAEELIPCAIIKKTAPATLSFLVINKEITIRPMCLTEE
jgi:hypothetical protein